MIVPIRRRSYKLKLPSLIKIFDTFHTSLLRPIANDLLPKQRIPPPPLIIVEREGEHGEITLAKEHEVDAVVDLRRVRRKLVYIVK